MNNLTPLLTFAVAVIPVILLSIFIYKEDHNKEPLRLLIKLFISGIAACFLVFILSDIIEMFIPFLKLDPSKMTTLECFIYVFLEVGLLEEFCKWLFTYKIGYNNREFDELYDMIVYATFVALGFAAFENILYLNETPSLSVGIFRGLFAIPGHVSNGVFMGYYLSMAKIHELEGNYHLSHQYKLKSIFIPALLHGIYDYCLLSGITALIPLFFLFIIVLYSGAMKKLRELSEITNRL